MKRLTIVPDGWKCKLSECPPGFFLYDDDLCFKNEYGTESKVIKGGHKSGAYCSSGEIFWGDAKNDDEREKLEVQPVNAVWEEYEL